MFCRRHIVISNRFDAVSFYSFSLFCCCFFTSFLLFIARIGKQARFMQIIKWNK